VLRQHPRTGLVYVVEVVRKQVAAPDFAHTLRAMVDFYPGAPLVFHAGGGGETGSAQWLQSAGVPLRVVNAGTDKYVRAQPFAAAWNGDENRPGRVVVPSDAPWSRAYLNEIEGFTGGGDRRDDQVDATGSAFSALPLPGARRVGRTVRNPSEASGFGDVF